MSRKKKTLLDRLPKKQQPKDHRIRNGFIGVGAIFGLLSLATKKKSKP